MEDIKSKKIPFFSIIIWKSMMRPSSKIVPVFVWQIAIMALHINHVQGGTVVQYLQLNATINNTLSYDIKLDNKGNIAELTAGLTVTIDSISTNFTASSSHGSWWKVIIEKTGNFTSISVISLTFDENQMPSFTKAPFDTVPSLSYDSSLDLNPPVVNSTNSTEQIDQIYEPSSAEQSAQQTIEVISSVVGSAFKSSLVMGQNSVLISLLSFINLASIYYFLDIEQVPDRIKNIQKAILKGVTANMFLPDDAMSGMSTDTKTDEIYSQFSIGTNFFALFAEFWILIFFYRMVGKLWYWMVGKKQAKYGQIQYCIQYFIGSLPLIIISCALNISQYNGVDSFLGKFNLLLYHVFLAITFTLIVAFAFLIAKVKNRQLIADLYMDLNLNKGQNKRAQQIVYLEVALMVLVPACVLTWIEVFWAINLLIIARQLYLKFNCNIYESKILFTVRIINKIILMAHHLIYMCYAYIPQQEIDLIENLSLFHFYLIVLICVLQVVNIIYEFVVGIVDKVKTLCKNSVQDEEKETPQIPKMKEIITADILSPQNPHQTPNIFEHSSSVQPLDHSMVSKHTDTQEKKSLSPSDQSTFSPIKLSNPFKFTKTSDSPLHVKFDIKDEIEKDNGKQENDIQEVKSDTLNRKRQLKLKSKFSTETTNELKEEQKGMKHKNTLKKSLPLSKISRKKITLRNLNKTNTIKEEKEVKSIENTTSPLKIEGKSIKCLESDNYVSVQSLDCQKSYTNESRTKKDEKPQKKGLRQRTELIIKDKLNMEPQIKDI